MSSGMWSAVSGAIGQLAALDATANNLANAGTAGYHGDAAAFREVLCRAGARPKAPGPLYNPRYAVVDNVGIDESEGPVQVTGRALDVAIKGPGFFVVGTENGERYTRAGSVQVDASGKLLTRDGRPFLGQDRRPLSVTPGASPVEIGEDGSVLAGGAKVGELLVVQIPKGTTMSREAGLLLRADLPAPPPPTQAVLATQSLEMSNVSAVRGMVDIMRATRGFEACERAVDAFKEADRRAIMGLMKE